MARNGLVAEAGDFFHFEASMAYRARSQSSSLKGHSAKLHIMMLMQFWLTSGVVLPVWVDVTGILSTTRVRIHLTPKPPFLSVMTLTILGQPKVLVTTMLLAKNFLNVMDVPGLSGWLHKSIDAAISEYVAPRSLTMDLKTLLMGREKMDTEAHGIVWITIKCAEGFNNGDGIEVWKIEDGRKGDVYVTACWGKWGKPLWSTRITQNEGHPAWVESTTLLVAPAELNAQERLQLQLWDSNRFTADDNLGTIEIAFAPMTHLAHKEDENVKELKKNIEEEAQAKLREAEMRKQGERKKEDLHERTEEIVSGTPPSADWPVGILSVYIEQINGVEVDNPRKSGSETTEDNVEDEEGDDLPSPYCTIVINHAKYNAGTEQFIKNWSTSIVMIAIRDSRLHEVNPLISVVVLPLRQLFTNRGRSQVTDSFPLVGGMGYGRLKCSVMFRSVQLQPSPEDIHIPWEMLGWDVGTLKLNVETIRTSGDLPDDLKSARILFRTLYSREKALPADNGGWHPKKNRPIQLAVKNHYVSCLLIQFRKTALGPEKTPDFGAVKQGKDMVRGRFNASEDIGEKLGKLELRVRFWPGLSGYHHYLADKDPAMANVMEVLDTAEDSEEVSRDMLYEEGNDELSESSNDSDLEDGEQEEEGDKGEGEGGRVNNIKTTMKDYNRRKGELHRKHRGLMQWSAARKVAWITRGTEVEAKKMKNKVMGKLKHQQKDGGVEKEV
ncbi:hypothetical protein BT96DRAFT_990199 [Gymnopus androsaceus JB14]|uniref:C2 domain-containing protein n=1 Tax=Gymnopus androsaceus JB14 TaxID=1447944 RepID=A0A6A4I428_9AGAR|nr:hypothetical protein BT96DRAFT_990199 [Gymnopus androsaceus JB14]